MRDYHAVMRRTPASCRRRPRRVIRCSPWCPRPPWAPSPRPVPGPDHGAAGHARAHPAHRRAVDRRGRHPDRRLRPRGRRTLPSPWRCSRTSSARTARGSRSRSSPSSSSPSCDRVSRAWSSVTCRSWARSPAGRRSPRRLAAQQDQFWPMHDYLFANQLGENVGSYTPDRLMAMAQAAGPGHGRLHRGAPGARCARHCSRTSRQRRDRPRWPWASRRPRPSWSTECRSRHPTSRPSPPRSRHRSRRARPWPTRPRARCPLPRPAQVHRPPEGATIGSPDPSVDHVAKHSTELVPGPLAEDDRSTRVREQAG